MHIVIDRMYLGTDKVQLAPMRVAKKCTLSADAPEVWDFPTIYNLNIKLQTVRIKLQIVAYTTIADYRTLSARAAIIISRPRTRPLYLRYLTRQTLLMIEESQRALHIMMMCEYYYYEA